jgi:POT family proton-dependent oligopeptide transporter
MAVSVGSTIAMLATPWLKDYVNATYGGELGWHIAFGAYRRPSC